MYQRLPFGQCIECFQPKTGFDWCCACNAKRFQQNFKNWTSGNNNIDKFIQDTQLSATCREKVLEWIPYDSLSDIKYIAKGGFGKVYEAYLSDPPILYWDNKNQEWVKVNGGYVALKSLNNSKNVTLDFINEITLHHNIIGAYYNIVRIRGITQDPKTEDYMMVLEYAEHGSLRNYLDNSFNRLNWGDKIINLHRIAIGLNQIHEKDLVHRDLHVGNILKLKGDTAISDMGLCKPADYNESKNRKNNVYGVLPYIAPEILRGQSYTKAADIYSFGIIMYEVISGLPPYHNVPHNKPLALNICQGLRPIFNIKVPKLILHLIKSCLDANSSNRPTAKEIEEVLRQWWFQYNDYRDNSIDQGEIIKQIKEAEEINNSLSSNNITSTSLGLSYETHCEAIYTSRLLNFNNLPEPKNSDDYYKQYDNISSMKYSESLQIDISQLKMNDADEMMDIEVQTR